MLPVADGLVRKVGVLLGCEVAGSSGKVGFGLTLALGGRVGPLLGSCVGSLVGVLVGNGLGISELTISRLQFKDDEQPVLLPW